MTAAPDLSIIIVNWRSAEYLRKCLQSVFAHTPGLALEILVVDNASYDGCAEILANEFPAVKFIQSPENLGFARANNLASTHSTGRNLLFLNPDTEVPGPALEEMTRFLDATPDAGVVGCRLLNSDGSTQTSCIQAFPTILGQILDAEALRRLFPSAGLWGIRALQEKGDTPAKVDAVSGACQLIRSETFQNIGKYTCEYFMYSEDVDLCYKARQAGLRNYFLPSAIVTHHGGGSSASESFFSAVLQRESRFRFFRKHRGRAYAGVYRIAIAAAACVRMLFLGVSLVATLGLHDRRKLAHSLTKWWRILRWTIGMERWAPKLIREDAAYQKA